MIGTHELNFNKTLHPMMRSQMAQAANLAQVVPPRKGSMEGVWVQVNAPKVTDTPARQSPRDFVALPGFAPDAHFGILSVERYVDNPDNRRKDRVGEVYFKIRDFTRGNGMDPYGFTNLRPEQITGFVIRAFVTPSEEVMATRALAEAAAAQTPQGV